MPFCPSCSKEYSDDFEECPDCGQELVEELSEDHFEGEIVEIFSTFSAAEAGLVKELLVEEGIFCAVSNELGGSIMGGVPSELGEARVYVSQKDEKRARDLIEIYLEENPIENSEDFLICDHCGARVDEDEDVCPFCGEPFEE